MDVREVAVITANIGDFEEQVPFVEQSVDYDFYSFDDSNFSRRKNSMSPRLQARIPKMFGWQMAPGHRYYLWIDSSCALLHENSIQWFLDHLDGADMAFFKHPHRHTIKEEADYLKHRLEIGCPYITPRYEGELIDEQLAEINRDTLLYATTAFIYRDNYDTRLLFKEWWYHTSRYHSIDQLSLGYAIEKSHCKVNVIPDNYLKIPYMTHIRNKDKNGLK